MMPVGLGGGGGQGFDKNRDSRSQENVQMALDWPINRKIPKTVIRRSEQSGLPTQPVREHGLTIRAHNTIANLLRDKGIEFDGTPECARLVSLTELASADNCGAKTLAEIRSWIGDMPSGRPLHYIKIGLSETLQGSLSSAASEHGRSLEEEAIFRLKQSFE
jgi:hypothetical protein